VPVSIHGVPGQPRPRLVGRNGIGDAVTLSGGGSLAYLEIVANSSVGGGLNIDGAVASGLVVTNAVGTGANIFGPSVLRDSVVRVAGANPAIETKDGKVAGAAKLLNVTVYAAGDAALKVKQKDVTGTIRNSIFRGASDVLVYSRASVAIDHSDFRPAQSSGSYTDAGSNTSADPLLDPDLHPLPGSPAIDAGTAADADLGSFDPDGAQRTFGAAPDMGAFEFGAPRSSWDGSAGAASTGPTGTGPTLGNRIDPPTPPRAGTKVTIGPVSGSVMVRTPGGNGFVPLGDDASVPVGSTIDATHGVVELTSARGDGDSRPQTGRFWGGRFEVRQTRGGDGYTELVLSGGGLGSCPAPARAKVATAARTRAVRQLWGQDRHGRFRTRGHNGQATVRGTHWLTQDRCDGTLFRVVKGAIAVRARGVRKQVVLRAGQHYLPGRASAASGRTRAGCRPNPRQAARPPPPAGGSGGARPARPARCPPHPPSGRWRRRPRAAPARSRSRRRTSGTAPA
jgi:hypothetical protein